MKLKFIKSILCLTMLGGSLFAQEKVKVRYEIKPFWDMPAEMKAEMSITLLDSTFDLILDKNESQYTYVEKLRNEQPVQETGMISAVIENRADGILYKNLKENLVLEEMKMDQKSFLIKDELPKIDWKITKETKNVAGFDCYKATAVLGDKNKSQLTAWYSPKLTFKNGPDHYWGLPGLILELEQKIVNEDSTEGTTYIAQKVEILSDDFKINRPTKGKVVSQAEFMQLQEENMKKMMEMYSGGVEKD